MTEPRRAPKNVKAGARRVALDDFTKERQSGSSPKQDQTIDALLDAIAPHVSGMVETLGWASRPVDNPDGTKTPGDISAAKTLLDFMSKALTQRSTRGTNEILKRIAEIRSSALPDALAEDDIEVPD